MGSNMNEDQQSFESLRRLLALKRHETPPAGYFKNFSSQVIGRIRASEVEAAASLSERLFTAMPWLPKLLQSLETKPVYAGGFATALCALLLFGALVAQQPESASSAAFLQPVAPGGPQIVSFASATSQTPAVPVNWEQPIDQIMLAENSSTNPVFSFQPVSSAPFGQMPVRVQLANYPGGN
jgi:hypothetical protein